MDYSNPDWQAVLRDSVAWQSRNWKFDGYRVDVADGYGLNWKPTIHGPHKSLSTLGGTIGMLKAIRKGATQGGGVGTCPVWPLHGPGGCADDPYLNPSWVPTWKHYPWQLAVPPSKK